MRYSFLSDICDGPCEESQIKQSLKKIGFKFVSYFGDGDDLDIANFVLAKNDTNQYVFFIIDDVIAPKSIRLIKNKTSLVPEIIRLTFLNQALKCKIPTIFITHGGIEIFSSKSNPDKNYSNNQYGISFLYEKPELAMSKLKFFGHEFYHAVPMIHLKDVSLEQSVIKRNLSEMLDNPRISIYRDLLSRSTNPNILNFDGPYTAFIPTNERSK